MKSNCKTMTRESASVVTQQGLWLTLSLQSLLMDGLHFILGSSKCGEWLWWRPLKNVHSSAQHQGGQKNDSTFCRWTHSCNMFQPKAENTPHQQVISHHKHYFNAVMNEESADAPGTSQIGTAFNIGKQVMSCLCMTSLHSPFLQNAAPLSPHPMIIIHLFSVICFSIVL